jgi:DNA-binding PadR family transcriptional regulator
VRLAVLLLLAEEPMHGYQIITELTERSDGMWRPSPGSVYPTLQQLEDEGLVVALERDGRRTFSLTDDGRATVEALPAGRRAPWEEMVAPDDDTVGMRRRITQVAAAAMQVMAGGTEDQIARAEEVLAEAQRALYRLLSEDPADA